MADSSACYTEAGIVTAVVVAVQIYFAKHNNIYFVFQSTQQFIKAYK
jgi:hypothetical protein